MSSKGIATMGYQDEFTVIVGEEVTGNIETNTLAGAITSYELTGDIETTTLTGDVTEE